MSKPVESTFSRRSLLHMGCQAAAGAAAFGCGALDRGSVRMAPYQDYLALPQARSLGQVALSVGSQGTMPEVAEAVTAPVTDFSWLRQGDSIFIKVACNSGCIHPAVTSPRAVAAAVDLLRSRGAGTVYVGDQGGVEHVRLTENGRVGSTQQLMARNGLAEAVDSCGAELHCFDDTSWDSYFRPEADFPSHWESAPWLPRILQEVDHVVYLPRIAAHALAGYTCGIKTAVGWLRDDSRMELHLRASSFYEKYTEINHFEPLRSKLKLVLTLCDRLLLSNGPNTGSDLELGSVLGVASTNLVDHDALCFALLQHYDSLDESFFDLYLPHPFYSNYWNQGFVGDNWGEDVLSGYTPMVPAVLGGGLEHDTTLSRLAVLKRYRPRRIQVVERGAALPCQMRADLRRWGRGVFVV